MADFAGHLLALLAGAGDIEPSIREFFLSRRAGVIYGAGAQAQTALELSQYFGKPIVALCVSQTGTRNIESQFDRIPLLRLGSIPPDFDKTLDAVIAVNEKFNDEVQGALRAEGFSNIYHADAWSVMNQRLRNLFWDTYFSFHKFSRRHDADGDMYLEYAFDDGLCRFYAPEDRDLFRGNFSNIINDIILPSLVGDFNYLWEGPYEHGSATLRKGDIVLDLGANLGLFSAVAAAKGCRVYAFEPTPEEFMPNILRKTASLYENVTICPLAVSNVKGKLPFNVNTDLGRNPSTVSNSILRRDGFSSIEVDGISLDEFVKEYGLSRVDFIKADIEGAERLMLQGACETLARFAPRLSLCTYHLPDDPEVMERLILEANPEYVFERKWSKLFAHCR